jgi:hypothetical protein
MRTGNRRTIMRSLLAAVLALAAGGAVACGYCVTDKMAAVYDHAVVVNATQHAHRVAFFALGGIPPGAESQRTLQRIAESVRGIDRGTARASSETAALSFAFDPKKHPLGEITRALDAKLQPRGCYAELVTVLDKVTPILPGGAAAAPAARRN